MALLEGDERSQMPSMSWNSVVRERTEDVADRASVDAAPETDTPETGVRNAPPAPLAAAPPVAPVAFSAPPVTATPPPAGPTALVPPPGSSRGGPTVPAAPIPEASAPSSSVMPPQAAPVPTPIPTATTPTPTPSESVRPDFGALSIPDFDDHLDHTSQPIATAQSIAAPTTPTVPIVARVPGATLAGGFAEALPTTRTTPTEPLAAEPLPEIVEATPSSTVTSQIAVIGAEPTTSSPMIQPPLDHPSAAAPSIPDPAVSSAALVGATAEAAPAASAPVAEAEQIFQPAPSLIPATQPNQALSLPPIVAPRPPAGELFQPIPVVRPQRKDRSGSIARIGFFFLIVAALGSAAVIFGRPFLFPADWDAAALEFAEPIEAARGTEFVEPVVLTAQPTPIHRSMVASQLLGDTASNLAMWRALGLAGPDSTDDATLQTLISELSPVLYSATDGQVYYDESFTRSDRSALITRAMVAAALDQEYSFSTDELLRSLDDAALTEAHVRQQSARIEQTVSNGMPLPASDLAALAFLPVVLDYRLTAPVVFEQLLPPIDDVAANPLAGIATSGPGPLAVAPIAAIASSSVVVGDTPVGPAVVTDRSFWYLSFASHVDAPAAYRMSVQLRGAGLQMVDGANGRCAVATFATVDAATNAILQADLGGWVAAAAPELGATVTALADGSVQLRSCDPVGPYASNIGFGAARELIAWRSVELAVTNLVVAAGGTEAEVAAAVELVGSTPSAAAVAQLPAGTSPTDLAAAAQAAANDVVASAPAPG